MSTSRRLRAVVAAAASVLLAGGCAAGTHPGAAAVVGKTEITVGDVDKTSRAVSAALGGPFETNRTLNEMVNNALVAQIREQRSITVTEAETAEAMKVVVRDETVYQKFEADPVARDFLHQVAATAITTIKLGGGTGINDPQLQQVQQAGLAMVRDASKDMKIEIAPRFGEWTDGRIDAGISGSLSSESAQTKADREADQQPQGQG